MRRLPAAPFEAGVFRRLADFGDYRLGDVYAPENQPLRGRVVRDIANERRQSNFGTLLDIVIADELRTVLWPIPQDDDGGSWDLRREVWNDPRALIGGSDAGAHLDRMCGAPYTTRFLADCLRGRQLISLERAIELITSGWSHASARIFHDSPSLSVGSGHSTVRRSSLMTMSSSVSNGAVPRSVASSFTVRPFKPSLAAEYVSPST